MLLLLQRAREDEDEDEENNEKGNEKGPKALRAIKDWVHGFWGYIVANFGLTLWQVNK